ncbi:MAG: hypothetical protein AAGC81_12455 [Pseudomonadota bacterium]
MAKFVKAPQNDTPDDAASTVVLPGDSWLSMWQEATITQQIAVVMLLVFFARLIFGLVFWFMSRQRTGERTTLRNDGLGLESHWEDPRRTEDERR